MRALTVVPGRSQSAAVDDVPEPPPADGALLVQTRAVGVCGTDMEIVSGHYGWAPPGRERLILGHESIGRVLEAPSASGFAAGDWIVGIVRRPDPVPCPSCAAGEWDMCRNGRYTERGIKERDGYASERFRLEPDYAIKIEPSLALLGVLVEPTSVVAKAWDHVNRIGSRASGWTPKTVLVTGAGPVGLLAALIARQRGCDVHVSDRVRDGVKPQLVRDLGATYHTGQLPSVDDLAPDVILECTGAPTVVAGVMTRVAASGVVCLVGVSTAGHTLSLDVGDVNRRLVLQNQAIFGSVNANRAHFRTAADVLARADRAWLARLVTRRVALDDWPEALQRGLDDVKVVIELEAGA